MQLINAIQTYWQRIALPVEPITATSALRAFSWQFSLFFTLIFMGLLPWLFDDPIPWWPLAVSVYLLISAWLYMPAMYLFYRAWMVLATILSVSNTYMLLAFVFFIVMWPIAWVMRILGKLDYQANPQPNTQDSYYRPVDKKHDAEQFKRPF